MSIKGGRMDDMRLAMGGVGAIPWRAKEAEALLKGQAPSPDMFQRAAEATFQSVRPLPENAFKVELGKRCLVHALNRVTKENA